ncbi:hypothetical protein [Pyrolobus fumarii]|uniref:hypothetical protein n=1 Tax=Pyrolobus fumarii TaxID=54252 RepID=UPI001432A266|nr:hypothetical protein [Pyrolobus fumarii]
MEFSDIHVGSRLLRSPGVLVDHRVYERFCVDPGDKRYREVLQQTPYQYILDSKYIRVWRRLRAWRRL